ncbi:MAG: hypothetical protein HYZ42_07850 [Bacteroidetes bacterium]|nr:hypothetical protein [Bacteroidota bacterium]
MQSKKSIILYVVILTLVFSCKKEEKSEFTDTPIIESYLHPGDFFNVEIRRQSPFSSNVSYTLDDIDKLSIQVTLNNNIHLLQPLGGGKYIDSSLIVSENDNYNLSFIFNSKTVTAYSYVPTKPLNVKQSVTQIKIERLDSTSFGGGPPGSMPDPVKISWDNSDNSYYLILVENIEPVLDPIRSFGGNAPPSNFFRKQPSQASSEEIRSMEFQYYGTHRIIVYHVLPDYAALYDQSSTSSQNLANPSTSIANGYGIFTGLNSDTLMIEVKEP